MSALLADFQAILSRLAAGEALEDNQSAAAFDAIMAGNVAPAVVGAFLMGLKMRGETAADLVAAAGAMRRRAIPVAAPAGSIDTCGTGGDGLFTLNVSTAAAIVTAACGVKVAKHGNRSATSRSSSAGVLEALGVVIGREPAHVERCLAELGITFILANAHHPAMKAVAEIRRALKVPTIFNLVGPLTNPAKVTRQVIGVYAEKWLDPMAEAIGRLGAQRAWIIFGAGGMDELSLAGPSVVAENRGGHVTRFTIVPEELGLTTAPIEAIRGGDAEHNAAAMRRMLTGEPGAYRDTVILNAAAALVVGDKASTLAEGVAQATAAIDSGKAVGLLDRWIYMTKQN
ncbi:anthranilate phosphoribosyltransferase [Pedomonas mirosovicensis]|uniref:anthranilate phosphoribosyltransferase n=1 Tax=Pedomonas mirosovicensis TaxID=2908641 RepID=UPI0021674E22|nr:anthranilate phosphoribosyltransferase [Pedomonas mirosovicensis]MCH8685389.1 anthranilate phosphoribosyltransferase [Pedomonas mirosovicensis]